MPRRISKVTAGSQAVRGRCKISAGTGQQTVLKPELKKIPQELRKYPNWVGWRFGEREKGKKPPKPPLNPKTGRYAKPGNLNTCGTFEQAVKFWRTHKEVLGIGFDFTGSPYSGVDLDNCRDPETGTIELWAAKIVKEMNSYTEITPSGKGIHILVKGKLPGGGGKKGDKEMYDEAHYFTITGRHIKETPPTVRAGRKTLRRLYKEVFGSRKPIAATSPANLRPASKGVRLTDSEIIKKASRARNGAEFLGLWTGGWSGHPSQSEGDFRLCRILAFWTQKDPVRIDRLFRQSGLMRDKWDRGGKETYGARTIRKAIKGTRKVYVGR